MSARRAGCANTSAAQREVSPATGGLRLRAGLGFRGFRDFSGALGVGGFRDFSGALGVEGVTGFIEFRGISEIQSCVYIYIYICMCVCVLCVRVCAFVCFGCGAVTDWTSSRFGIVQRRLGCESFGEPGQFGAYVNLKVT